MGISFSDNTYSISVIEIALILQSHQCKDRDEVCTFSPSSVNFLCSQSLITHRSMIWMKSQNMTIGELIRIENLRDNDSIIISESWNKLIEKLRKTRCDTVIKARREFEEKASVKSSEPNSVGPVGIIEPSSSSNSSDSIDKDQTISQTKQSITGIKCRTCDHILYIHYPQKDWTHCEKCQDILNRYPYLSSDKSIEDQFFGSDFRYEPCKYNRECGQTDDWCDDCHGNGNAWYIIDCRL